MKAEHYVENVIIEAERALPHASDGEVVDWIKANRVASFPAEVHAALLDQALRVLVRKWRARRGD